MADAAEGTPVGPGGVTDPQHAPWEAPVDATLRGGGERGGGARVALHGDVLHLDAHGDATTALHDVADAVLAAEANGARAIVLAGLDRVVDPPLDPRADAPLSAAAALVRAQDAVVRCGVPVLCVLRGEVAGAALQLALMTDVPLAATSVRLRFAPVTVTTFDGGRAADRLVAALGPARAALLVHAGGEVVGPDALRDGLVADAVPDDALDALVADVLGRVLAASPLAQRLGRAGRLAGADVAALPPAARTDPRLLRHHALARLAPPADPTDDEDARGLVARLAAGARAVVAAAGAARDRRAARTGAADQGSDAPEAADQGPDAADAAVPDGRPRDAAASTDAASDAAVHSPVGVAASASRPLEGDGNGGGDRDESAAARDGAAQDDAAAEGDTAAQDDAAAEGDTATRDDDPTEGDGVTQEDGADRDDGPALVSGGAVGPQRGAPDDDGRDRSS